MHQRRPVMVRGARTVQDLQAEIAMLEPWEALLSRKRIEGMIANSLNANMLLDVIEKGDTGGWGVDSELHDYASRVSVPLPGRRKARRRLADARDMLAYLQADAGASDEVERVSTGEGEAVAAA